MSRASRLFPIVLSAGLALVAPEVYASPPDDVELEPGKKVQIEQTSGGTLVGTVESMSATGIELKLDGGAVVTVPYATIASVAEPGATGSSGDAYRVVKRDGTALRGTLVETTDDELVLKQEDGTEVRVPFTEVRSLGKVGDIPEALASLVGQPVLAASADGKQVGWGTLEGVEAGAAVLRGPDGGTSTVPLGGKARVAAARVVASLPQCRLAESVRADATSVSLSGGTARVPAAGMAYACAQAGVPMLALPDADTLALRVAALTQQVADGSLGADQAGNALLVTLRREASDKVAQLAAEQIAQSPEIQAMLQQLDAGTAVGQAEALAVLAQIDDGVGAGLDAIGKNLGTPVAGFAALYDPSALAPLQAAPGSTPGAACRVDGQDRVLGALAGAAGDPAGTRALVEAELTRMARLRAAETLGAMNIPVVEELALVEQLRNGQLDLSTTMSKLEDLVEKRIGGDFKLSFVDGGLQVEWSMTLEGAEAKR